MESFSVELHSSASSKLYPQNTIASFTNFLPGQINLEGERQVALTDICFPSKLFKITEGSFGNSVTKGAKVKDSEKYKLSPGYYPTKKTIVSSMFAKVFAGSHFRNLHKMESKVTDFSVDTASQRIFMKTMPGLKIFSKTGELQHIFASCLRKRPQRLMIILQILRLFMIFNGCMQYMFIPILSIIQYWEI